MRKANEHSGRISAGRDSELVPIRTGTVKDKSLIVQFIRSMVDEMAAQGGRAVAVTQTAWLEFEERLSYNIEARDYLYLLAEASQADKTAVGLLVAYLTRPDPIFVQTPWLHISAMYVAPKVRRRGIGSAMLERALEWGKKKGVVKAQLHVLAGNPARKLYARFGFEPFEFTLHLKLGGQEQPDQ